MAGSERIQLRCGQPGELRCRHGIDLGLVVGQQAIRKVAGIKSRNLVGCQNHKILCLNGPNLGA